LIHILPLTSSASFSNRLTILTAQQVLQELSVLQD